MKGLGAQHVADETGRARSRAGARVRVEVENGDLNVPVELGGVPGGAQEEGKEDQEKGRGGKCRRQLQEEESV